LTVGCSASLDGEWVDSPKSGNGKEFKVKEVTWIGESEAEVGLFLLSSEQNEDRLTE